MGGVRLMLRLSYLQLSLRFTLVLDMTSEAPDDSLQLHITDWQHMHLEHIAESNPLRETVQTLCNQHLLGFGRVAAIADTLDGVLRPKIRLS